MLKMTSPVAQNRMRTPWNTFFCRIGGWSKWTPVTWQMHASFSVNVPLLITLCPESLQSYVSPLSSLVSSQAFRRISFYLNTEIQRRRYRWVFNKPTRYSKGPSPLRFGRDTRQAVGHAPAPASTLAALYGSWMSFPTNWHWRRVPISSALFQLNMTKRFVFIMSIAFLSWMR